MSGGEGSGVASNANASLCNSKYRVKEEMFGVF